MGLWRWKKLSRGMRDYLRLEKLDHVIEKLDEFEKRGYEHLDEEVPAEMAERVQTFSKITGGEATAQVIRKALHCVGCGVCLSRCESGALELIDSKIYLDEDKCISCGLCLHPCPVVDYPRR